MPDQGEVWRNKGGRQVVDRGEDICGVCWTWPEVTWTTRIISQRCSEPRSNNFNLLMLNTINKKYMMDIYFSPSLGGYFRNNILLIWSLKIMSSSMFSKVTWHAGSTKTHFLSLVILPSVLYMWPSWTSLKLLQWSFWFSHFFPWTVAKRYWEDTCREIWREQTVVDIEDQQQEQSLSQLGEEKIFLLHHLVWSLPCEALLN